MNLNPITEKYILHWGEMGSRWGVNRTVAQIHALLFLSPEPLHAEAIAETLQVARSNVSTSLRELQNWGLIKTVPIRGDRREHVEAIKDVWAVFRIIVEERKRREFDPTLTVLRDCVLEAGEEGSPVDPATRERMVSVLEFMELLTGWLEDMKRLSPGTLKTFLRVGAQVQKLLPKSS